MTENLEILRRPHRVYEMTEGKSCNPDKSGNINRPKIKDAWSNYYGKRVILSYLAITIILLAIMSFGYYVISNKGWKTIEKL